MVQITRRKATKALVAGCTGLLVAGKQAWASGSGNGPAIRQSSSDVPQTRSPQPVPTPEHDPPNWSDVFVSGTGEPTISYRSGWAVYEESFMNGQLVGRGWDGAGYVNFYDNLLDPADYAQPESFRLEMDGQALATDWKWKGLEKTSGPGASTHITIQLQHSLRPVKVKVHTDLDGTSVLTRTLEIMNTGARPAALTVACPLSGVLKRNDRWRSHLGETGLPLYSLGYFDGDHWGEEGDFHWHDLPSAKYSFDGRFERERWRHPFFVLRNNASGEMFVGQLAWTGGYEFTFDLNPRVGKTAGGGEVLDSAAALTFSGGPAGFGPMRVIEPGETVKTPAIHFGMVIGDLDAAVQAMHTHIRRSVMLEQPDHHGGWVESGIGPEVEITTEQVNNAIDEAALVGAEVFFIDASWSSPPRADWWRTVGNWRPNLERFPQGLEPFRQRVHAAGMKWGLWMDAERVGDTSQIAKEHPDWLAMNYDGARNMGGQLDLTNPAAAQWVESEISRVIQDYQLDFFRLDYNTGQGRGIRCIRDGYVENGYWRYYQTLYRIWENVRSRFPHVVFENCAGGGGRTDLGLLRTFDHTDQTDWQIAPRSFMITNGMTMALPPEYQDRLVGGQNGASMATYDFQVRLLLFTQPKIGFLWPMGAAPNPLVLERTKHWIDLYKNFVRPFVASSRIYHHTPEVRGLDPQGWGVLELCSEDRRRGMCGLFQLSAPVQSSYLFRSRGLDPTKRYRVTFDSSGDTIVIDGFTLMNDGLRIRREEALTSELLVFEATA